MLEEIDGWLKTNGYNQPTDYIVLHDLGGSTKGAVTWST